VTRPVVPAARVLGGALRDRREPDVVGRGCAVRGALEVTMGRISTACSRVQIGQF
jgi:hypothetical protein